MVLREGVYGREGGVGWSVVRGGKILCVGWAKMFVFGGVGWGEFGTERVD